MSDNFNTDNNYYDYYQNNNQNQNQYNQNQYGNMNQNQYGNMNQNQYGNMNQNQYYNNPYNNAVINGRAVNRYEASEESVRSILTNTFLYMFLGLLVTGIVAFWVSATPELISYPAFMVSFVLELGLVFGASSAMKNNNVTLSYVLFFAYAAVNGFSLSIILLIYESSSIKSAFLICSIIFGVMAFIGATTKVDLTNIGSLCAIGLFGVIIASVVNFIIGSSSVDYVVSIITIVIFIGLTAYDTQKVKNLASSHSSYSPTVIGLWGALELYLDFINLFLRILRIMGRRR